MGTVFGYLQQFNIASTCFKLILAMSAGGLVGIERERKRRPAGFRTYMLVALGAALTMILSQYLNFMLDHDWAETVKIVGTRTDVSRFGAQVINGVGFLGAGTIIVTGRQEVKGLTTAAALWASACMGLAAGAGFYECVFVCFILILLCMRILPILEDFIISKARNINLFVEMDSIEILGNVVAAAKAKDIKVYDVEIEKNQHDDILQISVMMYLSLPKQMTHLDAIAALSRVDGIISIEEI